MGKVRTDATQISFAFTNLMIFARQSLSEQLEERLANAQVKNDGFKGSYISGSNFGDPTPVLFALHGRNQGKGEVCTGTNHPGFRCVSDRGIKD